MAYTAPVFLLSAALTQLPVAQPPAVRGRVVADDDGTPIVNARVAIDVDFGARAVLTDEDGSFTLPMPPRAQSTVRLAVGKTGYGRAEVKVSGFDVEVRLQRGAVVSGRVTDEFGEPVQNARLMAEPSPATGSNTAAVRATTDDRGEYRLSGLPPGRYVISSTTVGAMTVEGSGAGIIFRPTVHRVYYPSAATPSDAEPLELAAGDERPDVNFAVAAAHSSIPGMSVVQPALAQPPAPAAGERATAAVRGRVVDAGGRGLARAVVRIAALDRFRLSVERTDANGTFEFHDLPAGRYALLAAKTGYRFVPPTPTIVVADGEVRDRADVTLRRWGSIAGDVVDERGDPVQGVAVQCLQVRFERGRRRLAAACSSSLTDDLGRYRLSDVPPGRYVVSASAGDVGSAELPGYARSFYPGTPNPAQAQLVTIGDSQEVTGIELALSRTPTARVAGTLLDAGGRPTTGGSVMLLPIGTAVAVGVGARIGRDGQFEFTNVAAGQYIVRASRGRKNPSTEGEFGALPVSVDGADVTGLTLQTSAGSSIHGRITFDARDPSSEPPARAIELSPVPVNDDVPPESVGSAEIHDDWTFDVRGVSGLRRLTLVRAPDGWMLQQIRVNGIDATDRPIAFGRPDQSLDNVEVVLTDRVGEVAGTIASDPDRPASSHGYVVVFSTDRSRWYPQSRFFRAVAAKDDGAFLVRGLPFGTYYIAAIPGLPEQGEDAWQDPEQLDRLIRHASAVTVRDGERTDVHVISAPTAAVIAAATVRTRSAGSAGLAR